MRSYNNKFNFICILQEKKIKNLTYIKPIIKIITDNEGSHTRVINYLSKTDTTIKTSQLKDRNIKRRIRYVWLETSLYTNITFARSLWNIQNNKSILKQQNNYMPIGQLFIKNKSDIHKEINEIYICYCKDLEKKLKFSGIIWGRKYILNQKNNSYVMIQEFFSPNLMFFN
uniref:Chorismate lyase n=1 Tax=Polysiphonia scopulorum TaxID=257860 RepID=A0A1Z1MHU6_9FLOR|nr:hypothetical protein [Polysiphonia scopulorum]ARW65536.1 hypothetical protein [Polysiphonia scopulorum]